VTAAELSELLKALRHLEDWEMARELRAALRSYSAAKRDLRWSFDVWLCLFLAGHRA